MTRKAFSSIRAFTAVAFFIAVTIVIALATQAQQPNANQPPVKSSATALPEPAAAATPPRQNSQIADAQDDPANRRSEGLRFQPAVAYGSGGDVPQGVAIADVNGDGKPDIVVPNYVQSDGEAPGVVGVLLGNGDGTFQPVVTYETGGAPNYDVVVADVNGDGKPDLIVSSCALAGDDCGSADGVVSVLLGNGDGTFQSAVNYDSGAVKANELAVADVNGDGILDVVVTNWYGEPNGDGTVSVLFGNGNGTFQKAVNYDAGAQQTNAVSVADVNGDGIPDLIIVSYCTTGRCGSGSAGVLLGKGDGTFEPVVIYPSGGRTCGALAVADVNGDGYPDLVVGNLRGNVGVLLGVGNGQFEPVVTYNAGGGVPQLVVADMNGDGYPDIVAPNGRTVSVLLGNGNGTFNKPVKFSSGGSSPNTLAVGDLNGDGMPDIVVTNGFSNSVGVLLNSTETITTTTTLTSSPNPSQVNQNVTFTATITSSTPVPDGEIVTFYHGKTVLGTAPTTNGAASFVTSFAKAGAYTIQAKYPGDSVHLASSGTVKQAVKK